MTYTMEDFKRQYIKEHFVELTLEEQREALAGVSPDNLRELLQLLPLEERLGGLSPEALLAGLAEEQLRQLLEQLTAGRPTKSRKPRRKR